MSALAEALTAPLAAAAVLLVLAGVPKVARPHDLRRALARAGLRVPGAVVRAGGAAEALLGVAALTLGGRVLAALVAVSYALFTGFVVAALTRGWALATCGCFGREDTPPSPLHAALTGVVAVAAGTAAVAGTAGLVPALAGAPVAQAVSLLGLTALVAWLLHLSLTALPALGVRVAATTAARDGDATSPAAPAGFRLLPLHDVTPRSSAP